VGQSCLKAVCLLSVTLVPAETIECVVDVLWKVKASESWKARISMLEFVQVMCQSVKVLVINYPPTINFRSFSSRTS